MNSGDAVTTGDNVTTPAVRAGTHAWRLRWFLALLLVLGLATGYGVIWSTYVKLHTIDIHHQQQPGASAERDGVTYRALSLRTQTFIDSAPVQAPDQEPGTPAPGAIWVSATIEVSGITDTVFGGCQLELLGPDGRTWEPISIHDDLLRRCSDETGPAPTTVTLTYLVPEQWVDQLYGLIVQSDTVHVAVIRP